MQPCPNYLRDHADTWAQDPKQANLDWFTGASYGLFLHYGLYTQLGRHEWAMFRDRIPINDYERLADSFDPSGFEAHDPTRAYMAPQILTGVDHSMRIMTEETFGPAVGIMPVTGDEEALRLMNDSVFGLTASIWTRDADAARRLGGRRETGTVFMNRCDYLDPALAWTGVKDSGYGCTLSQIGFESLTRPKSFRLRL